MNGEPRPLNEEIAPPASSSLVHALIRFYWVLRRRKLIVFTSLGIFGLLGVLFYASATRVYQASASLLVLKVGSDALAPTATADRSLHDQMATYERLCTSTVVLEGVIERLQVLPPEMDRGDRSHFVDRLRELLLTKTIRRTSIIEVACRSRDPQACVNVLDAVVSSYLDFIDRNHRNIAIEIVSVLDRERIDLENRIERKQQQLLEAKHRGGDIGIKKDSRVVHPLVQRVVGLNEALLEIQQRRIQLEAIFAAIRRTADADGDVRSHLLGLQPLVGSELVLSALGLNDREVTLMASTERQLLADQAALDSLGEHYGPRHPRVVQLRQRIRGAHQYLATIRQGITDRLSGASGSTLGDTLRSMVQEHLTQTLDNERQLRQQYDVAEADAIALNHRLATVMIVERDLELLRNMHAALVNRIENTDINQNQADVRVSVINEPAVPSAPFSPKLAQVVLLCLALGTGTGVLAVYIIDVLDDRFRSPEELQEQLNLPVLAMIRKHSRRQQLGAAGLQVHVAPNAVESEAFRTLRTTLAFSRHDVGRVAVTSSEPGDGKTTVLANLGVAYAQAGKRTLLIDGDLRCPGLTTLFGMRTESGLSDILRGDEGVAQMCARRIQPAGVDNLDILPCGPRPSDPASLLSHERFSDLLGWAETIYDQILVDSPPILAASDAAIMGRLIDGVLMVVQPQNNHRRRVLRAVENISSLGVCLLGIVVNAVTHESTSGYYGYGADYGFGYGYGTGYGGDLREDAHDEPDGAVDVAVKDKHGTRDGQAVSQIPVRRRAA